MTVKVILKEDDITLAVGHFLVVVSRLQHLAAHNCLDLGVVRSVVLCCISVWNIFGEKPIFALSRSAYRHKKCTAGEIVDRRLL